MLLSSPTGIAVRIAVSFDGRIVNSHARLAFLCCGREHDGVILFAIAAIPVAELGQMAGARVLIGDMVGSVTATPASVLAASHPRRWIPRLSRLTLASSRWRWRRFVASLLRRSRAAALASRRLCSSSSSTPPAARVHRAIVVRLLGLRRRSRISRTSLAGSARQRENLREVARVRTPKLGHMP